MSGFLFFTLDLGKSSKEPSMVVSQNEKELFREEKNHLTFPVVGIGASAGGFSAFKEFLGYLPSDIGMSFIFVQHLDPKVTSHLTELVSNLTKLNVVTAKDGVRLEPDTIYIQPENSNIQVVGNSLKMFQGKIDLNYSLPIDSFFKSLAKSQGENSIAVILSGLGSDGSSGIQFINEAGGIVFAQDEKTCEFPSMPTQASSTGFVDFILSPRDIAIELTKIKEHRDRYKLSDIKSALSADGLDKADLDEVLRLIREKVGINFGDYKKATIERRIFRRMEIGNIPTLSGYIEHLKANPDEVNSLYFDLLIGVTKFFRNPDVFKAVKEKVIPHLVKNNNSTNPIRVWVPGCSTGEEVYSLAILFSEYLHSMELKPGVEIQFFGTDVSEKAVKKARRAIYPDCISSEVSSERLKEYFVKTEGGYQIKDSLREKCVFAVQNITKDPPFSKIDFISCRNLFIYFDTALQRRVLHKFHYSLNKDGVLLMGAAESLSNGEELYTDLDHKHRIFLKKDVKINLSNVFSNTYYNLNSLDLNKNEIKPYADQNQIFRQADLIILNRFSPVSVLVDKNLNILQIRGDAGFFLAPPIGLPSYNLIKMAHSDLRTPIHTAFKDVSKNNQYIERLGIQVTNSGVSKVIDLKFLPFRSNRTKDYFYIVSFCESSNLGNEQKVITISKNESQKVIEQKEDEIKSLQYQLSEAQSHLQATLEEFETTNEEVLTSNEELQSTNEELQTSKEEIQSANEELSVLNTELQMRNDQLVRVSDDLQNLLNSVQIAVILVSSDLRIRSYTEPVTQMFSIIPTDVGRPIQDIKSTFHLLDIENEINAVIKTTRSAKLEIQDTNDHWFNVSIFPYKTKEDKIDGAVVLFEDINNEKIINNDLENAKDLAETANKAKSDFLANMSHEIRTPLAAIIGFTDLLIESLPEDLKERTYLEQISKSGNHLRQLIDDVLDLAKIEAGKMIVESENFYFLEEMGDIFSLFKAQASEKGVEFIVNYGDELPIVIKSDALKIRQILNNILGNALKFTSSGKINLDIQLKDNFPKERIEILVTDTGCGIDKKVQGLLFEAFSQADSGITRKFGGTGLGLCLSRKLARSLGGDVVLQQSRLKKGSSFLISFTPESVFKNDEWIENKSLAAKKDISFEKLKSRISGKKILVVEDDDTIRKLLEIYLEQMGLEVYFAFNGKEGVEKFFSENIQLVFMDIQMPESDGYEATSKIREKNKDVPIIALTARLMNVEKEKCLEAGCNEVIAKPFNIHQIIKVLSTYL